MHYEHPRKISLSELKRLGSFCDAFNFGANNVRNWNNAYDRIGNSVPPRFMQAIAEHVRDAILKPSPELAQ